MMCTVRVCTYIIVHLYIDHISDKEFVTLLRPSASAHLILHNYNIPLSSREICGKFTVDFSPEVIPD